MKHLYNNYGSWKIYSVKHKTKHKQIEGRKSFVNILVSNRTAVSFLLLLIKYVKLGDLLV